MILAGDSLNTDRPDITTLYAREVVDGADQGETGNRMRPVMYAGNPYMAAELEGTFADHARASAYRSRAGYRWGVEDTVHVATGSAGPVAGKALPGRLIDDCELRGFAQMVAVIGNAGNAAGVSLHRRLGFETVSIFKGLGRKHGRWLDNLQMQHALGAGCTQPPSDT